MRKAFVLGSVLVAVAFVLPSFGAATTTKVNVRVPISFEQFVPCANGGAGEILDVSGSLNVSIHTSANENGGTNVVAHFNPQKVTGVGRISGDVYQGTGMSMFHTTIGAGGLPFNDTFIDNFNFVGPGTGNNLITHDTVRVTINANGDVTADVTINNIACK